MGVDDLAGVVLASKKAEVDVGNELLRPPPGLKVGKLVPHVVQNLKCAGAGAPHEGQNLCACALSATS